MNVNPRRATDADMWPCLSCNKHGDLQGGSLVFDQVLAKYSVLQHAKAEDDDDWRTVEADSGPWPGAGPSPVSASASGTTSTVTASPNAAFP